MTRLSAGVRLGLVVSILLAAGGCARLGKATSSGAYQVEPGTYKIVAIPNQGSFMDARNLAYDEARATCAALGEEMHVRIEYANRESTPQSIELTFGCP